MTSILFAIVRIYHNPQMQLSKYFPSQKKWKMRLVKCLKSSVSEQPSTINTFKDPKHSWNLYDNTFIIYFNHKAKIELEHVSLSDIWNLLRFC